MKYNSDELDNYGVSSRYSGKKSSKFWKLINNLPEPQKSEAYSLGCVLQNVESDIRKAIGHLLIDQKNSKKTCDDTWDKWRSADKCPTCHQNYDNDAKITHLQTALKNIIKHYELIGGRKMSHHSTIVKIAKDALNE